MLKNVEIRAGNSSLDRNFKGKITINKHCGIFAGPGNFSQTYTVNCTKAIMARYITLQTRGNYTSLAINELSVFSRYILLSYSHPPSLPI